MSVYCMSHYKNNIYNGKFKTQSHCITWLRHIEKSYLEELAFNKNLCRNAFAMVTLFIAFDVTDHEPGVSPKGTKNQKAAKDDDRLQVSDSKIQTAAQIVSFIRFVWLNVKSQCNIWKYIRIKYKTPSYMHIDHTNTLDTKFTMQLR